MSATGRKKKAGEEPPQCDWCGASGPDLVSRPQHLGGLECRDGLACAIHMDTQMNHPLAPVSPFDPTPPKLCPDPQLGTRVGYEWCADCCGIQPPGHVHGDPIEQMDAEELRRLVRVMRMAER